MVEKELKRSNDKWIAGVCSGLAKYFGISPMVIRLLWVVGIILTWPLAIGVYIVLAIVLKKE